MQVRVVGRTKQEICSSVGKQNQKDALFISSHFTNLFLVNPIKCNKFQQLFTFIIALRHYISSDSLQSKT